MRDELERAAGLIARAQRLVVLTGAGVSTESGIPDFRGPSGLWSRFQPSDFEYARFLDDPAGFWRLRERLMDELALDRARPNAAHDAIARASHSARFLGHVTQNIDGLFTAARHTDDKLIEIHGSARTVRCIRCKEFSPYEPAASAQLAAGVVPPRCAACAGVLKPGTVLFGEDLPADALDRAARWMRRADAVLVVGSSLRVHPVAALPAMALDGGAAFILVNEGTTGYDVLADVVLRASASKTVPHLFERARLL